MPFNPCGGQSLSYSNSGNSGLNGRLCTNLERHVQDKFLRLCAKVGAWSFMEEGRVMFKSMLLMKWLN